jgi:hypothetical protein
LLEALAQGGKLPHVSFRKSNPSASLLNCPLRRDWPVIENYTFRLTMNYSDEDRLVADRLALKVSESAGREGVYYLVRFPTRWRLYAFAWEDFGDLWHGEVWRRFVVDDLVEAWNKKVKVTFDQLAPWWKGFPRGRVERVAIMEYTVFHGTDFTDTGISSERIERAFELGRAGVKWSFDPHEEQNSEHCAALLRLLPVG